jgi:hypothetical protein
MTVIYILSALLIGFLIGYLIRRNVKTQTSEKIFLEFYINNIKIKSSNFMIQLKDNQKVLVAITGAPDSKGQPTTLQEVTAVGDNDAAVTFSINADGKLEAIAVADGTATVTVNAKDADGTALPAITAQFTVVSQDATAILLTAEEPTLQ